MHVTIGRVSTRKGARQHLDTLGRAHCGAGTGITMAATRWTVDGTVHTDTICRRCLPALRTRLAEAAQAGCPDADAAAYMLAPADVAEARDAALLADISAHLTRVHAVPAEDPYEVRMARVAALLAPAPPAQLF